MNLHGMKYNQDSKILKSLFEQKNDGTFCDVKLNFKGTIIWSHACVLASCSIYFSEFLNPSKMGQCNWGNHWCVNKPMVIDLERIIGDIDLCLVCICKIIDFMYLKELEIGLMQGHFQHFLEIANFLKVVDLVPLCKQIFSKITPSVNFNGDGNIKHFNWIDCGNYSPEIKQISNKTIHKEKRNDQENNHERCNIAYDIENEVKNNETTESGNKNDEIVSLHKNEPISIGTIQTKLPTFSNNTNYYSEIGIIQVDHSYGIKEDANLNGKCEFICCSSDTKSSICGETKLNKRRKLTCELCKHSSFSVQKMLKHIESKNHFGTICSVCNNKMNCVNDLKQHLKDHADSKPYKCPICNKRNKYWEYHRHHLSVHCRNKPFVCELCKKSFKYKNNLATHMMAHKNNYRCSKCDYITDNTKTFEAHIICHREHLGSEEIKMNHLLNNKVTDDNGNKSKSRKQFNCQSCKQSFTQKRNLTRHIQVKHTSLSEHKCCMCPYMSKRTDLLRHHMKKHHNYVPSKIEENKWKEETKETKRDQGQVSPNNVVGVLIPVQLISTENGKSVSAFAVKSHGDDSFNSKEHPQSGSGNIGTNDIENLNRGETDLYQVTHPNSPTQIDLGTSNTSDLIKMSMNSGQRPHTVQDKSKFIEENINSHSSTENSKEKYLLSELSGNPNEKTIFIRNDDFSTNCICKKMGENNYSKDIRPIKISEESVTRNDKKESQTGVIENVEDIWLNEATGELSDMSNLVMLSHVIDGECIGNQTFQFNEPLQTIYVNESQRSLSVFDVTDDDDLQSEPQTPHTNIVEFEDRDNLFSWNCLENNFCSTWVLNEATGELEMVSFNVQPLKHSDALKLDENSGRLSSAECDDEDTALFLNEGTGDLSVIYFNPSKSECNARSSQNEQQPQENLDTISEHSSDDTDFLNEEFLKATASFMAHEGNERFLNELTGEFDIANLNYQPEIQESQTGVDHIHLNEETGEISWNVLDDIKKDLVNEADNLNYDLEDSLHCEDFESFFTEMNEFSSDFSLSTNALDESCDTMLNECTGELIKKG